MATNNKAISAYIPPLLEECLTKYCTEYDITRKDKSGEKRPALGTAVVEILKIFFSSDELPSPLPDNVALLPSNVVTEDQLNQALSELKTSSNVSGNLPSYVVTKDELSKVLSNVDKQVDIAINEAMPKAIADLKNDEEFIQAIALRARDSIATEVQKISTVTTDSEKHPLENALEQAETTTDEETITQVDQASLTSVFDEVDEVAPVSLLSQKEAYAIALQRGYKSSATAFAQWFRGHKGDKLHGIQKHQQRGKYIDTEN